MGAFSQDTVFNSPPSPPHSTQKITFVGGTKLSFTHTPGRASFPAHHHRVASEAHSNLCEFVRYHGCAHTAPLSAGPYASSQLVSPHHTI